MTVDQLIDWLVFNMESPDELDKAFILDYELINSKDDHVANINVLKPKPPNVNFVISTRRLLNKVKAETAVVLHIDSTYKVNAAEIPLAVVGVSDAMLSSNY